MATENANSSTQGPAADQDPNSVETTMKSDVDSGATKTPSENSNSNNAENSAATSDSDGEKLVEYSDELIARGKKSIKEGDYAEAIRCYKRATEIRLVHLGQCTRKCAHAYEKYGCALLYEAGAVKSDFLFIRPIGCIVPSNWKLLEFAQVIVENHSDVTMENVDILLAIAQVAWEEAEYENSVIYFLKALSMLEQMIEPDSRLFPELIREFQKNIHDDDPMEMIKCCEKAMSVCESIMDGLLNREAMTVCESGMERLMNEKAEASTSSSPGKDLEPVVKRLNDLFDRLNEMHEHIESELKLVSDMAAAGDTESLAVSTARTDQVLKNSDSDSDADFDSRDGSSTSS